MLDTRHRQSSRHLHGGASVVLVESVVTVVAGSKIKVVTSDPSVPEHSPPSEPLFK